MWRKMMKGLCESMACFVGIGYFPVRVWHQCAAKFDRWAMMPDKTSKPEPRLSKKGQEAKLARAERQAALLRKNLLKRKAQQRIRKNNGSNGDDTPGEC